MRLSLQRFFKSTQHHFIKLERCSRGNILIIAALAAFVLVGAVGVAIDMSRAQSLKSRMQTALDAANLATGVAFLNNCSIANTITQSAQATCLTTAAQNSFNANFPAKYLQSQPITVTPDLTKLSQGYINVTVSTMQKTSLIAIMGVTEIPVSVISQVQVPTTGSIPGSCGSEYGVATSIKPSGSGLCSGGATASLVSSTLIGWTWTCTGSTGVPSNCSAPINGTCPVTPSAANPYTCLSGTVKTTSEKAGAAYGTGVSWACSGTTGGTSQNCCVPGSGSLACVGPAFTGATISQTSACSAGVIQPLIPTTNPNCGAATPCVAVQKPALVTPCVAPAVAGPAGPPTTTYTCACSSTYGTNSCASSVTGSCQTPCVAPASATDGNLCATFKCATPYGPIEEYINGVLVPSGGVAR